MILILSVLTLKTATGQTKPQKTEQRDTIIIERVVIPKLKGQGIEVTDYLIEKTTYQLILEDLQRLDSLQHANEFYERNTDSLLQVLRHLRRRLRDIQQEAKSLDIERALLKDQLKANERQMESTEKRIAKNIIRYKTIIRKDTKIVYRYRWLNPDDRNLVYYTAMILTGGLALWIMIHFSR